MQAVLTAAVQQGGCGAQRWPLSTVTLKGGLSETPEPTLVRESKAGAPGRDKPKARGHAQKEKREACLAPGLSPAVSQAAEAPPSGSVVGLQTGLPRALQA